MSFWGLILEPKKSYTQRGVEQPFHISSAALDLQTADGPVSVVCRKSDQDFILCSLSKEQGIFNVPLNLDFEIGSEINFHVIGDSAVHLTGYIVDEMEMDDDSSLDELEEEEEEAESKPLLKNTKKLLDAAAAKRKPETKVQNVSKKAKVEAVLEDDDDDDEDDSDFEAEDSVEGEEVLGEEEEDDDDDDDDEDDDDDDDDDDDEDDEENDAEAAEILKKLQSMKGNKSNQPNQPAAKGSPNKGDKNAKQGKKDQANNQQKNQPNNQQKNQPNKQNGTSTQSNGVQKKVLAGGVQIEDTQLGNGMVASNGKQVTMYYVGRLKQTNKQFDSCTSGSGFKFRLGRGEVIKGWDIGVAGMKVGGKRRLTIPAKMAYGKEGAGKTIPPNSTLVFDVELRQVK